MSGSPVYAQENGVWAPEGQSLAGPNTKFGRGNRFIGIYAGRVGDDVFQAQLGIVWKQKAIDAIIDGNKRGRTSFRL